MLYFFIFTEGRNCPSLASIDLVLLLNDLMNKLPSCYLPKLPTLPIPTNTLLFIICSGTLILGGSRFLFYSTQMCVDCGLWCVCENAMLPLLRRASRFRLFLSVVFLGCTSCTQVYSLEISRSQPSHILFYNLWVQLVQLVCTNCTTNNLFV